MTGAAAPAARETGRTIRAIDAIPVDLPLVRPIRWARGELHRMQNVLVVVTLADGTQGIADAPPRPTIYGETQASLLAIIRDHLAPPLVGADAFDLRAVRASLDAIVWNPAAKAAIDMAIHDALGKSLGIPCAQLLGGSVRPLLVNWRLALDSTEGMLADADDKMSRYGFRAFKVKCGLDARKDIEVLTTLRRHVGDDVEITVDMNQGYDVQTLIETAPALAELGVALVEEPVPARDGRGKRFAAGRIALPISGDDGCATLDDVRGELELGAIREVVIKCARTGYTVSRDILALARAHHVSAHVGTQADMAIGCVAGGHFACTLDSRYAHEFSTFLDASDHVVDRDLVVRDGQLLLPDGPGLGLSLDPGKLARYRLDR